MNPFERLRQAIDKVNINYTFPEEQVQNQIEAENDQPASNKQTKKNIDIGGNQDFQKVRELCQTQQTNHIRQINILTNKVQQLTKSLKKAQINNETLINDIVAIQKENQLLKQNLKTQYNSIENSEQKERKYKEEIYRIGIAINQLASELNHQRTNKKNLLKEIQNLKSQLKKKDQMIQELRNDAQNEIQHLKSQLNERVQMYEYNVKKNSQDRKEYRSNLTKIQQQNQKDKESFRKQISQLRAELFQVRKNLQITLIRKESLEDSHSKLSNSLADIQSKNKNLQQKLECIQRQNGELNNSKSYLQKQRSQIQQELAEEKKNVKVQVIEVRDETLQLQLQMYKKQCKELMQEKAVMSSLSRERLLDSNYKIVGNKQVI